MEKCSIMVCVCSLYLTLGVKFYESVTFELFLTIEILLWKTGRNNNTCIIQFPFIRYWHRLSRYSRQVFEDVKIDRVGASSSDKTRPVRQSVPNLGLASCTISHTG